jgi:hypothetical protein
MTQPYPVCPVCETPINPEQGFISFFVNVSMPNTAGKQTQGQYLLETAHFVCGIRSITLKKQSK